MRAVLLSIAALSALAGAAEARTVSLEEFFAVGAESMAVRGATLEMAGAAAFSHDAGLRRCTDRRDALCTIGRTAERSAPTLTIFIEEGFRLDSLAFGDPFAPGAISRRNPSVIVNGVAYSLSELSGLSLSAGRVEFDLRSLERAGVTLNSFELTSLSTPLPAAGLLMVAGLGGIGLARSLRKKA